MGSRTLYELFFSFGFCCNWLVFTYSSYYLLLVCVVVGVEGFCGLAYLVFQQNGLAFSFPDDQHVFWRVGFLMFLL